MSGFDELISACQELDAVLNKHKKDTDECAAATVKVDSSSGLQQLKILLAKQHIVNANLQQEKCCFMDGIGESGAIDELIDATESASLEKASKSFVCNSETLKNVWQKSECTIEEDSFKKQTAELFTELHMLELRLKHTLSHGQQVENRFDAARNKWAILSQIAQSKKQESREQPEDADMSTMDYDDKRRFEERLIKLETMRKLTTTLALKSHKYKNYNWERDPLELMELIKAYRSPITRDSFL